MRKSISFILLAVVCAGLIGVVSQSFFPKRLSVQQSQGQPQEIQNKPYPVNDRQQLRQFVKLYKMRNDQLLLQGQRYLQEKKIDEAINSFQLAMEGTSDPRPYSFLINIYLHLGREEEAYRILEKAGYYKTDMNLLVNEFDIAAFPKPPQDQPALISIASFKDDKEAAVSFTFDDGAKSVYIIALPIFDAFGFKASIFVNPGFIRGKDTHPAHGNWDDWRDAHRRGFEIGNHGLDHAILNDLGEGELDRQVNYAYEVIKKEIGTPPVSFVFPQDLYDQRTVAKALEKHLVVRQHGFLRNVYTKVMTPFYGGEYFSLNSANKLVDWSIDRNLWLIPVCHALPMDGIESYKPITMEFLRDHLTYIHDRADKIWVDNFLTIYKYLLLRSLTNVRSIEQKDTSLIFALETSIPQEAISGTLTVVIHTSPQQAKRATAKDERTGNNLPVKIHGQKIILDLVPNGEPVLVQWE